MTAPLRECLLASYSSAAEAMLVQNVLEVGGVPCRVGDLANLPSFMFGILGPMGRSIGVWVLEVNVVPARALLAEMRSPASSLDEAAVAEEAMAAALPARPERDGEPEGVSSGLASQADQPPSALSGPALFFALVGVAAAAMVALRGCR
jgi:hypothetical protein